jgi:hypothetical protein
MNIRLVYNFVPGCWTEHGAVEVKKSELRCLRFRVSVEENWVILQCCYGITVLAGYLLGWVRITSSHSPLNRTSELEPFLVSRTGIGIQIFYRIKNMTHKWLLFMCQTRTGMKNTFFKNKQVIRTEA